MEKEILPNDLHNDGMTCKDCPHYENDASGETLGQCKNPQMEGVIITKEHFLTSGKNACSYFDM